MVQAVSDPCVQPDPTLLQAFAQFFPQPQLTDLVLTTVEELSSSRAQLSLASAQLMSAVIQERGADLGKVTWCYSKSSALKVRSPGLFPWLCHQAARKPCPSPQLALIH